MVKLIEQLKIAIQRPAGKQLFYVSPSGGSPFIAGSSSGELAGPITRSGRFDSGTRYFGPDNIENVGRTQEPPSTQTGSTKDEMGRSESAARAGVAAGVIILVFGAVSYGAALICSSDLWCQGQTASSSGVLGQGKSAGCNATRGFRPSS